MPSRSARGLRRCTVCTHGRLHLLDDLEVRRDRTTTRSMSSCCVAGREHERSAVRADLFVLVERRLDAVACNSGRRTRRRTPSLSASKRSALSAMRSFTSRNRASVRARLTLASSSVSLRFVSQRENDWPTRFRLRCDAVDVAGAGRARRRRAARERRRRAARGVPGRDADRAEAAAKAVGCDAGADRQVARLRVRRPAGARARPGRPARRRRRRSGRRGRGLRARREARGGARGDRLRAGRRRAFPGAARRAGPIDRSSCCTSSCGPAPARTRHMVGLAPADPVRLANARSSISSRLTGTIPAAGQRVRESRCRRPRRSG